MTENKWIANFFEINLLDEQLSQIESVKNFALFWNIFEKYFCDKSANLNKIKSEIYSLSDKGFELPDKISLEYYPYFKQKYLTEKLTNERFERLEFRNTKSDIGFKNLLKHILENEKSLKKEKILACFIIIYRFRNNLFHGTKNIASIDEQNENFIYANNIIMEFLTFLKKSGKLK